MKKIFAWLANPEIKIGKWRVYVDFPFIKIERRF